MLSVFQMFADAWIIIKRKATCFAARIFRYIQALSRKHKFVFPSHKRIAEKFGCSVASVKRALNRMRDLEWLTWKTNGCASCYYFIKKELIWVDLDSPRINLRSELTSELLLEHSSLPMEENVHKNDVQVASDRKKEPAEGKAIPWPDYVPEFLRIRAMMHFDFSNRHAQKFIESIPEIAVKRAVDDMKTYMYRWGRAIDNPIAFFVKQLKYRSTKTRETT